MPKGKTAVVTTGPTAQQVADLRRLLQIQYMTLQAGTWVFLCCFYFALFVTPMQRAKTSASIAHRCTMVKLHARSFVDLIV
jgi:hypothetical protein